MKKKYYLFITLTMILVVNGYGSFVAFRYPPCQALSEIIIPEQPSEAEIFAAEELRNCIQIMSRGVVLPIRQSSQIGTIPCFIIGKHSANATLEAELASIYPDNYDCFAISCSGNSIHFTAPHSSGLLYSVWDWLEKLGVAWLMPGSNGTYIPRYFEITVADYQKFSAPAFNYRYITTYGVDYSRQKVGGPESLLQEKEHGRDAVDLWPWRMRLNGTGFDQKDGHPNIGAGHSYQYYLPPTCYAQEHPEWFNLVGGRRLTASDPNWQVCFTNNDAAKQFASNMLPEIANKLAAGVPLDHLRLCVSPNDVAAICECSNCATIKDSDGTSSSQVLNFANMVAEEVQKTYPGAKIY